MKQKTALFSIICIAACFLFTSCSQKKEDAPEVEITRNSIILNSPVKSQKAYDRGLELGKKISQMESASREREYAVIEAHRMVSSLERNGFKQTAQDFAKGIHAGMKEDKF